MSFLANSHTVITTDDVSLITNFWRSLLTMEPHFENKGFSEFILPSGFRFAFFLPTGTAGKHFSSSGNRDHISLGLTVNKIDKVYQEVLALSSTFECSTAGAPKEHPWGEKSFLLIDPDGNRWEITESPTPDGILLNHE